MTTESSDIETQKQRFWQLMKDTFAAHTDGYQHPYGTETVYAYVQIPGEDGARRLYSNAEPFIDEDGDRAIVFQARHQKTQLTPVPLPAPTPDLYEGMAYTFDDGYSTNSYRIRNFLDGDEVLIERLNSNNAGPAGGLLISSRELINGSLRSGRAKHNEGLSLPSY